MSKDSRKQSPRITPKGQQLLRDRGLLDAAIIAGWISSGNGWRYPIFDHEGHIIGYRWKNYDSQAKPKYKWPEGKPDSCIYYHLPDCPEATHKAGGIVYLASGEPDVLAFQSGGIPNVFCWFGEMNVPPTLAADLVKRHVTEVRILADLDATGTKSAQAVVNALAGTTISVKVYALPETLGEKGDVNKLWIAVGFDSARFQESIAALPQIPMTETEPEGPMFSRKSSDQVKDNHKDLPGGFYDAIETALGVKRYNSRGFSQEVSCPFHDDRNPSAAWHREKHFLHCFTCGEDFLAKDVGAALKIDWRNYIDQRPYLRLVPRQDSRKHEASASEDADWLDEEEDELPEASVLSSHRQDTPTDDDVGDGLILVWKGNHRLMYGGWRSYQDGLWIPMEQQTMAGWIWEVMRVFKPDKFRPTAGKASSIESYLKAQLHVPAEECDRDHGYINLQNGLYNLTTGTLETHQRDLFLTSQLSFEYDPEATCRRWLQFLSQVLVNKDGLPDEGLIAVLQEGFGYSLTGETRFEKSFWLHGLAASGKSTAIKVLKALVGNGGIDLDLNMLEKNTYQLADLPGKHVATCTEAKVNGILNDSVLKMLISGEEMVARQIRQETVRFKPQVKVWWAMNELPHNLDRSDAIYRRLILIPFLKAIALEDQDTRLMDKLLAELPGIFNWALEGLRRLNENEGFTKVEQVEAAIGEYQAENDVEATFLNDVEWCDRKENYPTQASDLYVAYKAWCELFGHPFKSNIKVARDWERLGLTKKRNGVIYYIGVGLTKEAEDAVKRNKRSA